MKKQYKFLVLAMFLSVCSFAQVNVKPGKWRAKLLRTDGYDIPFELDVKTKDGKTDVFVVNGKERLQTEPIVILKDSLLIRMPVFESYFRVKVINKDSINGVWVKEGASADLVIPFVATAGENRFPLVKGKPTKNVAGKWKIEFAKSNGVKRYAIGNFTQKGQILRGSVITPSGDYRYLDGVVNGDSIMLSTFDGIHALLFTARLHNNELKGNFYSSASPSETWTSIKDDKAVLELPITQLKDVNDASLSFSFKDLDGNTVSFPSERYKNKVVIIQLMGSWCPNCMDEMAFLSDYYRKNKDRGVEVIALAYELTTDAERSNKSLRKFEQQFKVQYPILNTGVAIGDPKRTEKTLPQLTDIKVFPTSIILDKDGQVQSINTSFNGPGTGEYYTKYKEELEREITSLLNKK